MVTVALKSITAMIAPENPNRGKHPPRKGKDGKAKGKGKGNGAKAEESEASIITKEKRRPRSRPKTSGRTMGA